MTVDFYILKNMSQQQAWIFACALLEKIYHAEQSAYVHMDSAQAASRFDELLWIYQDNSFIPHHIVDKNQGKNMTEQALIQIGYDEAHAATHSHTLINFTSRVLTCYQQFNHIVEIVFSDPNVQQLARERYRFYRQQNCTIHTHQ